MVHGTVKIYETDVNECASMPCQNNGTCIDYINGFTCNCTSAFTGAVCETSRIVVIQLLVLFKFFHLDIDECVSLPCQNNGTCVDGEGVYTCICTSGFTGDQCETSNRIVFQTYAL